MNVWLAASIALVVALVPCALACLRGDVVGALAALNVAGMLAALALITLSMAFDRQSFVDLAVVLAPSALAGSFAFIRFLERRR